jgi:hypothetical protein
MVVNTKNNAMFYNQKTAPGSYPDAVYSLFENSFCLGSWGQTFGIKFLFILSTFPKSGAKIATKRI